MDKSDPKQLQILVIGGHPADVFDHCGGTLAHHIRKGDNVCCVALTQGLRIHDEIISEKLRFGMNDINSDELKDLITKREDVKYNEVKEACSLFGITDIRFMRYDEKVLIVKEELIIAIASLIREIKPHILITHYPLENGGVGSHHGNTGKNVMEAVMFAGTVDFDNPVPAWRTPQIFFMSPMEATFKSTYLSSEPRVYCDYYVDVSDVAEIKVRALAKLKSQNYTRDYSKRHTECWSGKDGHFMSVGYAESFISYKPEIGYCLKVSDQLIEWANEPEIIHRERCTQMTAEFVRFESTD